MRCEVCGKVCDGSLMLARHVVRSDEHERMQAWASSVIYGLRAGIQVYAEASAKLTKAMNEGWDDIAEAERIVSETGG